MSNLFKIGDTIKIVSRLYDEGIAIDVSTKTVRSVLKFNNLEIVGVISRLDNYTVMSVFSTSGATPGKYKSDIRFSENGESFSTPTLVIQIDTQVS